MKSSFNCQLPDAPERNTTKSGLGEGAGEQETNFKKRPFRKSMEEPRSSSWLLNSRRDGQITVNTCKSYYRSSLLKTDEDQAG